MLIVLQPDSSVPLYDQIAAAVRRQVADGTLRAGDRLPPGRELADALGVNLHTVLRGYQRLRDEGLLELRRGRGAVITGQAATARWREPLASFVREARRAGLSIDEATRLVREGMTT